MVGGAPRETEDGVASLTPGRAAPRLEPARAGAKWRARHILARSIRPERSGAGEVDAEAGL
jgi:hypothetical protein